MAVVVAGVVGFYSALFSLQGELNALNAEMARLRVEIDMVITPELHKLDEHSRQIRLVEQHIHVLRADTAHLRERTFEISQKHDTLIMTQLERRP